jgi:hypothetical protein
MYRIEWLIPERVLYVGVPKGVGINRWGAIQADMYAYMAAGRAPVHMIIEADLDPKLATNINDIRRVSGLKRMRSDKLGWTLIVQNHILVRLFGTVAIQVVGASSKYQFFSSFDAAVEMLKHMDSSLAEAAFVHPTPDRTAETTPHS